MSRPRERGRAKALARSQRNTANRNRTTAQQRRTAKRHKAFMKGRRAASLPEEES